MFATVESFDSVAYTAMLSLKGGFGFAQNVPCSRNISSALLVAGARVAVAFEDPADTAVLTNAIVYAVF